MLLAINLLKGSISFYSMDNHSNLSKENAFGFDSLQSRLNSPENKIIPN